MNETTYDYSGLPVGRSRSPVWPLLALPGVVLVVLLLYVAAIVVVLVHGPVAKL